MKTWGIGILDNSGASALVDRFVKNLKGKVKELAQQEPSEENAGALSGLIGLLLQIDPNVRRSRSIIKAIKQHEEQLDALPPEAATMLKSILKCEWPKMPGSDGQRPDQKLGKYVYHLQLTALFEHPAAQKVLRDFAERCAAKLDEMEKFHKKFEFCVIDHMGALAILMLINRQQISFWRMIYWQRTLQIAYRRLNPNNSDKRFFDFYMDNTNNVFKAAFPKLCFGLKVD